MRLAEKTVELNWCAQLNGALGRKLIWFGLTQQQEFDAGFDAYVRIGGAVLVFQFKASNYVLRNKKRRFYTPHHQLEALRSLGQRRRNSVFYVFPTIGNTRELSSNPDVIAQSQLLDAGTIPQSIGAPTGRTGQLRKSKLHYVDLEPGWATIHSDPIRVRLANPRQLLEAPSAEYQEGVAGRVIADLEGVSGWLREVRQVVRRNALGAILLPPGV